MNKGFNKQSQGLEKMKRYTWESWIAFFNQESPSLQFMTLF